MISIPHWFSGSPLETFISRSGVILLHHLLAGLPRTGIPVWPAPEVAQKRSKAELASSYSDAERAPLVEALGRYCSLQSMHSEDAMTWAAFGPLVYADQAQRETFVAELLRRVGLNNCTATGATVRLWRRFPHPESWTSGGPEIDAAIMTNDALLIFEAKWLSGEGRGQGVNGDKGQLDLRRMLCQDTGLQRMYDGIETFAVIGLSIDGDLLGAVDPIVWREVETRALAWAQFYSLESHPIGNELRAFLQWKRKYSQMSRIPIASPLAYASYSESAGLYCRLRIALECFNGKYGRWPTVLRVHEEWWLTIQEHLGPDAERNVRARLRIEFSDQRLEVADEAGRSYRYGHEPNGWVYEESAEKWLSIGPNEAKHGRPQTPENA